jgi:hypothetical protein
VKVLIRSQSTLVSIVSDMWMTVLISPSDTSNLLSATPDTRGEAEPNEKTVALDEDSEWSGCGSSQCGDLESNGEYNVLMRTISIIQTHLFQMGITLKAPISKACRYVLCLKYNADYPTGICSDIEDASDDDISVYEGILQGQDVNSLGPRNKKGEVKQKNVVSGKVQRC